MSGSGGISQQRTSRGDRGTSRSWFIAAVAVSLVCVALVYSALVGLVTMPPDQAATDPVLVPTDDRALDVAVARTVGGPAEWTNWARVIKYLSDELEVPLNVRYLAKEDEAADVIVESDVDIAFVCAHHYLDLTEAGEVEGVCVPVVDGSTTTRMWLIVRADDAAERMEDIRGSVVAASDRSSLGGYAYLTYLCDARGLTPPEFFSEVRLGDSQEANMSALRAGEIRATVVNSAQVVSWNMSEFRVIEESPPFGAPAIVVNSHMSDTLRERIAGILLNMDVAAQLSKDSAIDGFEPIDSADYDFARVLRDACGHHDHEL